MISALPSLAFVASRRPHIESENLALSPKRSFAQHVEDHLSQLEPKRRHVQHGAQPSRRAPLDPLSVSVLGNRNTRRSHSTDSTSYHSLVTVTPSSLPDPQVLCPQQHPSSDSSRMRRSSTSDSPICSWPPPIPTPGALRGSLAEQQPSLHSSADKKSTRGAPFVSSSTWHPPQFSQTGPTTTMVKIPRATDWKSENVLQPIRSRTTTMLSVRRPPEELWRSDSGPTKAAHESVDTARSLVYPPPPGLPARKSQLRRSGSVPDLLPRGSVSLSLALGSQPLCASEHTKPVPPIGSERSRVVSISSAQIQIRNSPMAVTHDPSNSPWGSPPSPDGEWKNEVHVTDTSSLGKAQAETECDGVSKEDLERLLRHAARNKHAPKIISPLSPLRSTTPAFDLSADPAYRLRMPSQLNNPSPRYSNYLPRRIRTVCDGYQSLNWDTTCMHCQECKRDSLGKRLLAFRYRQQQTHHHIQRNRFLTYPARGVNAPVVHDDRMVVANRIREVFAYEIDEEEKSLWEEVAAATSGGPVPFFRVGAPCAAAAYRRAVDDGPDDGEQDDLFEIGDEGLLANESVTLCRDVSVY